MLCRVFAFELYVQYVSINAFPNTVSACISYRGSHLTVKSCICPHLTIATISRRYTSSMAH